MTKPDLPPLPRNNGLPRNHRRVMLQRHQPHGSSETPGPTSTSFDTTRTSPPAAAPPSPQILPIVQQQILLAGIVARAQGASRTIRCSQTSGQQAPAPRQRVGSRSHLLSLLEEVLRIIEDDGEGLGDTTELE